MNKRTSMREVVVVIGSGAIGWAIAGRVGTGNHVILADLRAENASAAAQTLSEAGFDTSIAIVDVSSIASIQAQVD